MAKGPDQDQPQPQTRQDSKISAPQNPLIILPAVLAGLAVLLGPGMFPRRIFGQWAKSWLCLVRCMYIIPSAEFAMRVRVGKRSRGELGENRVCSQHIPCRHPLQLIGLAS